MGVSFKTGRCFSQKIIPGENNAVEKMELYRQLKNDRIRKGAVGTHIFVQKQHNQFKKVTVSSFFH